MQPSPNQLQPVATVAAKRRPSFISHHLSNWASADNVGAVCECQSAWALLLQLCFPSSAAAMAVPSRSVKHRPVLFDFALSLTFRLICLPFYFTKNLIILLVPLLGSQLPTVQPPASTFRHSSSKSFFHICTFPLNLLFFGPSHGICLLDSS